MTHCRWIEDENFECDCFDEEIDILTGQVNCWRCGATRYLSPDELDARINFEAAAQEAWDNEVSEMDKTQSTPPEITPTKESEMHTTPMSDEELALSGLQAATRLAHKTATNAGWYTDRNTGKPIERNFGEVVALMHSELSEALEADRKDLMDDKLPNRPGVEVEFADTIIRILDTAAAMNLDVAGAVIEKNRFNQMRADHKLEVRKVAGGKKY